MLQVYIMIILLVKSMNLVTIHCIQFVAGNDRQ